MDNEKWLDLVSLVGKDFAIADRAEFASNIVIHSIHHSFSGADRIYTATWKCHYCGSQVSSELLKCPSCAGERR